MAYNLSTLECHANNASNTYNGNDPIDLEFLKYFRKSCSSNAFLEFFCAHYANKITLPQYYV